MKKRNFLIGAAMLSLPSLCAAQESPAATGNQEDGQKRATDEFLARFMTSVLFKRDMRFIGDYFVTKDEYLGLKFENGVTEDPARYNHSLQYGGFGRDCEWIMDNIPKTEVADFRLARAELITPSIGLDKVEGGKEYRLTYGFESLRGSFQVVTPTVVFIKDKPKFVTRFWYPYRLL